MVETSALLNQWINAARIEHIGHSRAAAYFDRMHIAVGLPVTILAAAVGTSVFTALAGSENKWVLVVTGLASMAAAVLAALQTFLNYSERAASHASAAARYGFLRRRLEMMTLTGTPMSPAEASSIEDDWKQLDEAAPVLSQRFHDEALKIAAPARAAERLAA